MSQTTSNILMVRPAAFFYNEETAANNSFQSNEGIETEDEISYIARKEFDNAVKILRDHHINVEVHEDSPEPPKPDAIFPNNWFSTHQGNIFITYPMWAENRRIERSEALIEQLEKSYIVDKRYHFEFMEEENLFLEGTGSMILDRVNKIVYACLSPRTDIRALDRFDVLMKYRKNVFHAYDENGGLIYHTNVMMAVADQYVIVCLECIRDEKERKQLVSDIAATDKEIIEINPQQVNLFAGNMLQVENKFGETFLVMSQTAHSSLYFEQLVLLKKYNKLIVIDIPTIEKYGGGSIRCMMAEIFLKPR